MKKNTGFTIMELMVAIAIMAVLAAIVTPNIISFMGNQKLNSAAREVHSAIQDTRMSAVKENSQAWIWFSNDNQYRVWLWDQTNETWDVGAFQELPPGITMTPSLSVWGNWLNFNTRGMLNSLNGNDTLTVNGPGGRTLQIVVSPTGSSRITG